MKMYVKILAFMIIIVTFTALCIVYALYYNKETLESLKVNTETVEINHFIFVEDSDKMIIDRIKRSLIIDAALDPSEHDIIENYSFKYDEPPHNTFTNWKTEVTSFTKLCIFGIHLLSHYMKFKSPVRHLLIITNIVMRITEKNSSGSLIYLKQWKTWGTHISPLLQLMVMYEYLADDNLRRTICHKLITDLVPKLDQLFDKTINNEEIIFSGIPRLLTNFLFDRMAYKDDVKDDELKKLDKYFNIEYNVSDKVQAGLYMDGSCIGNTFAAQYNGLLPYIKKRDDFYDKMYAMLGFKVNYRNRVESVLQKLLHPSIKYHIVGLFDNETNKIHNLDWWNVQPFTEGVHIFPFIGVGVFKTPNLLFTIQLQQVNTKFPSNNKLTFGLMQLRKIYKSDNNEPEFTRWDEVINELGVIHQEDDRTIDKYACTPQEFYIGHLVDIDLLFWYNKYAVSSPYGCQVTEIGVITEGGLVSKYKIKNVSFKTLIFNYKDDYGRKNEKIASNETAQFPLEFIINKDKIASDVNFKRDALMVFKYNQKSYEVISTGNQSFIVKHNDEVILGGKANNNPNDFMVYNNRILKRTSSLMYTPQ